ncbi:MAG: hypothetical protein HZA50_11080 [Planctomycetes bacterium]|nr:hypothetical protein [Planctomycetota bacterium]
MRDYSKILNGHNDASQNNKKLRHRRTPAEAGACYTAQANRRAFSTEQGELKMKLWTLLLTMLLLSLCLPDVNGLFAAPETPATQKAGETKKTELSRFTEIIDIFTVNPDGSCKVEYDFKMPLPKTPTDQNADESGKNDPYAWVKIYARSMLKSNAIDAWTDLSLEITKDKKAHIKGTAYSKDFLLSVSHIGLTTPTWEKNDKAEMVLQIVSKANKHDIQTRPAELAQEQMDATIKDIREEYKNGIRDKILLLWAP